MEICKNVHQIRIDFEVTKEVKRYVYVYLIVGKFCYLIDTGVAGCEKQIALYMKTIGRNINEVKAIFLTHSHPDHIGSAAAIKSIAGSRVYTGIKEKEWAEDIDKQYEERPIPNFYALAGHSVEVDEILHENDYIKLEPGITIKAFETPGHSAGSMSYQLMDENVLFTGDAIPVPYDLPIFVDNILSKKTLEKISNIEGVEYYYPAWDRIYDRGEIGDVIREAVRLIEEIESCTRRVFGADSKDEKEKIDYICKELGFGQFARNPLFLVSIMSCLER